MITHEESKAMNIAPRGRIKIVAKKVWIKGEPMYEIMHVEAAKLNELPETYLRTAPYCYLCRFLRECVDTEEFWGFPCQRTTYECEYVCGSPEDPQCPEHGRWERIIAAGEVSGDYKLEDGDE